MWFYNFGLILYVWAIRLVAPRHPKARLWIEGHKDLFRRMREAIAPTDRIIWIHVASLGEFEQGRPIIEQLRKTHPEYKILLTFFSPSGYEIRKNYKGVDYIFYLPIDTPGNARRFLDAAHPEIAIFVKYEYWLNLLRELRRRKIRTYVVSAIFRRNSVFFRPYGGMWRQALESFDVMFVQNEESKKLLATLGFDNVLVAGDTRFDRVAEIARAARRIDVIDRFKGDNRLFVAGSTWEPDEELLIVTMEKKAEQKEEDKKKGTYLRREFSYTKFQQSLLLPDNVVREKIAAKVENGVMTIEIPKKKETEAAVAARQIEVR